MKKILLLSLTIVFIGNIYYFLSDRFYYLRYSVNKSGKIIILKSEFWIYNGYLIDVLPFDYKRNAIVKLNSNIDYKLPVKMVKYHEDLSNNDKNFVSSEGIIMIYKDSIKNSISGIVTYEIKGIFKHKSISVDASGDLHELGYLD